MKVMIVTPYFYPSVGGVQNYVLNLARRLVSDYGHEVVIITSGEKNGKINKQTCFGMCVYRLPYQLKLSNTPISFAWKRQIRSIIKAEKPDIINAHTPVPGMADLAILSAKTTPTILTYHAASLKKDGSAAFNLVATFYKILERIIFRKTTAIVAVSDYVKNCLPSKYQYKTSVIYNAIDPAEIQKSKSRRKSNTIIFIASLDKTHAWKGLEQILEATALATKKNPKLELCVLGDGNKRKDYIRRASELGISNIVHFMGNVEGKDKYELLQTATALVAYPTTENDAFPTVFTEAWACGTPIIAAGIGALDELIQDKSNGIKVVPRNPNELSKAIINILSDNSLRTKIARNGRKEVLEKFTWAEQTLTTSRLLDTTVQPNIVHVVAYYPPHLGGMENVVEEVTFRQRLQGFNVSVITSKVGYKSDYKDRNDNVKRLRGIELAHTPIMPGLLIALLRCPRNTVFHVHVAVAGVPEVALLVSKIKHSPIVMHIHADVEPSGPAGWLLPMYKKYLLQYALKHCNALIVPTKAYKVQISKKYNLSGKTPLYIIPAGVGEEFFIQQKFADPKDDRFSLLSVGRLSVDKNIPLLINAITNVSQPVKLTIVGDGPLRSTIESLAIEARQVNQLVEIVGRKSHDELLHLFSKADAFVLASDNESQSLTILEAMASGKPIIVAKIPAVHEVVKGAALEVDRTTDAFSRAIDLIAQNKQLRTSLGNSARIRARDYTWDATLSKLTKAYKKL